MSQTGYTPILIYASGTATNVPLAANLTSSASGAELALNYADGKLFYKDSGGVVQVLATKGTGSIGGANTQIQFNNSGALGGSANLTWDGTKITTTGLSNTGNTTLGDASADTLTVNATITSNLIFTDNTYDIGAAGATRPRNMYLSGKLGVGGATPSVGNLSVQADTSGHGIWVINDSTLNYGEIYFGQNSSSGYQGVRADGRSTGWLRLLTGDATRLNIDYLGAGTFYGTTWEFSQSYPYMNNILAGSVKSMMMFNTTGSYYAGFYDSGLNSAAGSRQYFARTSGLGVAPSTVLLALDYQNNRVGIGTINPEGDLQVSNPNGAGTTVVAKAISSGVVTLIMDSFTNSGGAATQTVYKLNGTSKWSFGYANIGAGGANDMGFYNYTTTRTPWILTNSDYKRLPTTAAFMATISSNYTSTGSDVVRFNTVSATGCFDNRSNFDTTNYRFVAPVDGWYQFNTVVNQYNVSAGTAFEVSFRKNGTAAYAGGRIYSGGSSDQQVTSSAVIYLSANEYVEVFSQQAGGFSASIRWNTFSGHLIG